MRVSSRATSRRSVAQAGRLLQLAAGLLQAQVKYLLPQVPALGRQFLRRQIFDLGHLHSSLTPSGAGK